MLTVDFDRLGLRPGDRVLDMGCGAGRHAFEMYRRGADVIAFDQDADELAAADLRIIGLYAEDARPVGERTTPVDSFTVVATPGPCPPPTVDP